MEKIWQMEFIQMHNKPTFTLKEKKILRR